MADRSPYTYTKGSSPVWFRRNNKAFQAPYTPPSSAPVSHRRTTPATPTRYAGPAIDQVARDWLLNDAVRMDEAADDADAKARQLRADASEWRTVAANYRRIALQSAATPEPVYDEPQRPADPDPSQFNPTWQIPAEPEPPECGCQWWRGETCERCDVLTPAPSILTPWSPQSVADLAGWAEPSTREFPAANGEVR